MASHILKMGLCISGSSRVAHMACMLMRVIPHFQGSRLKSVCELPAATIFLSWYGNTESSIRSFAQVLYLCIEAANGCIWGGVTLAAMTRSAGLRGHSIRNVEMQSQS